MNLQNSTIVILKGGLAVLLFLCLIDMPYGYYQLVRFIAFIVFGLLSYTTYENGFKKETIIYTSLAILFQPFIKIALGRELWNILDVIVGLGLIVGIFFNSRAEATK